MVFRPLPCFCCGPSVCTDYLAPTQWRLRLQDFRATPGISHATALNASLTTTGNSTMWSWWSGDDIATMVGSLSLVHDWFHTIDDLTGNVYTALHEIDIGEFTIDWFVAPATVTSEPKPAFLSFRPVPMIFGADAGKWYVVTRLGFNVDDIATRRIAEAYLYTNVETDTPDIGVSTQTSKETFGFSELSPASVQCLAAMDYFQAVDDCGTTLPIAIRDPVAFPISSTSVPAINLFTRLAFGPPYHAYWGWPPMHWLIGTEPHGRGSLSHV